MSNRAHPPFLNQEVSYDEVVDWFEEIRDWVAAREGPREAFRFGLAVDVILRYLAMQQRLGNL
jgi:hypothetical protein